MTSNMRYVPSSGLLSISKKAKRQEPFQFAKDGENSNVMRFGGVGMVRARKEIDVMAGDLGEGS